MFILQQGVGKSCRRWFLMSSIACLTHSANLADLPSFPLKNNTPLPLHIAVRLPPHSIFPSCFRSPSSPLFRAALTLSAACELRPSPHRDVHDKERSTRDRDRDRDRLKEHSRSGREERDRSDRGGGSASRHHERERSRSRERKRDDRRSSRDNGGGSKRSRSPSRDDRKSSKSDKKSRK